VKCAVVTRVPSAVSDTYKSVVDTAPGLLEVLVGEPVHEL
jgi:hypothetical protein